MGEQHNKAPKNWKKIILIAAIVFVAVKTHKLWLEHRIFDAKASSEILTLTSQNDDVRSTHSNETDNSYPDDSLLNPMVFSLVGNGGNCSDCVWISATGIITKNTPQKFKDFITENGGATIYFHSTGGDLWGGLELGKMIRNYGLNTSIGKTQSVNINYASEYESAAMESVEGICASSCAYAFLGGVSRKIWEGSIYALHQFGSASSNKIGMDGSILIGKDEVSIEQLTASKIAAYISDMGASPKLLEIASTTNRDRLKAIDIEVLSELNITNNLGWRPWEIDNIDSNLVMLSTNDNPNAQIGARNFACKQATPYFMLFASLSENTAKKTLDEFLENMTLKLDDRTFKVPASTTSLKIEDDILIVRLLFSEEMKNIILAAKNFEFSLGFPRFMMPLSSTGFEFSKSDKQKLRLVWGDCS